MWYCCVLSVGWIQGPSVFCFVFAEALFKRRCFSPAFGGDFVLCLLEFSPLVGHTFIHKMNSAIKNVFDFILYLICRTRTITFATYFFGSEKHR